MVTQLLTPLVVEVTERTSQVQTTVHTTHVHRSPRVLYTPLLLLALRLVVQRQVQSPPTPAQRTARVTRVGDDVVLGGDEHDVGSATRCFGNRLTLRHVAGAVQFLSRLVFAQQFVHQTEGFVQSGRVFAFFVVVKRKQVSGKTLSYELADLVACIR